VGQVSHSVAQPCKLERHIPNLLLINLALFECDLVPSRVKFDLDEAD
jgi:hypothetical protein